MKLLGLGRNLALATALSLGVAATPSEPTAHTSDAPRIGTVHRIKNVNSVFDLGCPRGVNVLKSTCVVTVTGGRVGAGISFIKNGVPSAPKSIDAGGINIACSTASMCALLSNDVGYPAVEWLVNGKTVSATNVAGMTSPSAIACETKTSCVVIGIKQVNFSKSYGEVALVTKGAKRVSATRVPGVSTFSNISCGSAHQCVAGGANGPGVNGHGLVLPITNGKPGTVHKVPGTWSVGGISCGSAHTCYGAGEIYSARSNSQSEHIFAIKNGKPGNLGPTTHVAGLSCWSARYCAANGDDGGPGVLFARVSVGIVGRMTRSGKMGTISGFDCPTAAACLAEGVDSHGHPAAVIVRL